MDSTVFVIVYNVLCFIADDRGDCSTLKTCINKYKSFLFSNVIIKVMKTMTFLFSVYLISDVVK